jgi:hypothetical protein
MIGVPPSLISKEFCGLKRQTTLILFDMIYIFGCNNRVRRSYKKKEREKEEEEREKEKEKENLRDTFRFQAPCRKKKLVKNKVIRQN